MSCELEFCTSKEEKMKNQRGLIIALLFFILSFSATTVLAQVRYEIKGAAHIGGYWAGGAVAEDYAFVAQGRVLSTIEVGGALMRKVNSLLLADEPNQIAHADDKLYLCVGQSDTAFQILDTSNPLDPALLGWTNLDLGWNTRLAVNDRFACVGSQSKFFLIDITNSALPVVSNTLMVDVRDVCLSADTAFVVTERELIIYDLADLNQPGTVSKMALKGGTAIAVQGNRLFVAIADYGDSRFGLQIIDISDRENPGMKGFMETTSEGETVDPKEIVIDGSTAFIGCEDAWLVVADVSDIESPAQQSSLKLTEGAFPDVKSMDLLSPFLYATTGAAAAGFVKVDVSEIDSPEVVDQLEEPWDILSLFSRRDTLYAGSAERLWIYKVDDPDHPILMGSDNRWGEMQHLSVKGRYTYGVRRDTLFILDTFDPANILLAGAYPGSAGELRRLDVRDQTAFLLNSDKNQPGCIIVDVSDAATPQEIAFYPLAGEARALHAPNGDSLVYIAYSTSAAQNGFVILDTRDPANPALLGQSNVKGSPSSIWAADSLLYVGSNADNDSCYIQSFNITSPAQPDLFNQVSKEGELWDLKARLPLLMTSLPSGSLYLLNGLKYCQRGYYYVPSSLFFSFFWSGGWVPFGMASMSGYGDTSSLRASASWGIFLLRLLFWLAVAQVEISPENATVSQGDKVMFKADASDKRGNPTRGEFKWDASGGEMDSTSGVYKATETGEHTITATDTTSGKSASTRITVTSGTAVETQEQVVREYRLEQNFPNPFNPETTISYSIKESGRVRLSLINIRGQKVALLVDQHQKPGVYRRTFTALDLPSGIYFYRLQANDFDRVRKMVLVE